LDFIGIGVAGIGSARPLPGVTVAPAGLANGVIIDAMPITDANGHTVLSITAPTARKQIELSLLIDQSFRRSLSVSGPDKGEQDAGVDAVDNR
jgi:hypothetical protein